MTRNSNIVNVTLLLAFSLVHGAIEGNDDFELMECLSNYNGMEVTSNSFGSQSAHFQQSQDVLVAQNHPHGSNYRIPPCNQNTFSAENPPIVSTEQLDNFFDALTHEEKSLLDAALIEAGKKTSKRAKFGLPAIHLRHKSTDIYHPKYYTLCYVTITVSLYNRWYCY